jgi:hypothetical protein
MAKIFRNGPQIRTGARPCRCSGTCRRTCVRLRVAIEFSLFEAVFGRVDGLFDGGQTLLNA